MSLSKYHKYKDSGVEWLGDVPAHWDVRPCRAIVQEQTAKNDGAKCEDYLSLMANIGIIPYAEKGDIGNKKPDDLGKCKVVTRGDFVINSMNYGIGSYGISDYDGVCSPVYIVLKPQKNVVESRFAFRIFENRAFQTFAQSFGNGILEHRCAINWDILKTIRVGIPPADEQQAILEFLDGETSKIGALVAEQQRLIELLTEKRQAVISHAVTKGLNSHVSMRFSGIEVLGDVPKHWEIRRVKTVSTFLTSGPRGWSDRIAEEGSIFVQSGDLNDVLEVKFDNAKRVQIGHDAETIRTQLRAGDVVVCVTGAKTGNVAVCMSLPEAAYVNQHLCLIRPSSAIIPMYLGTLLKSKFGQSCFELSQYGLKQGLSLEDVKETPVLLPPLNEQFQIIDFINSETAKLDNLTFEAQRAIDLLQERRTALISAAVTGKIDVRSLVETEAA